MESEIWKCESLWVRVSDPSCKSVGEVFVRYSGSTGQMLCCKGSDKPAGNYTVLYGRKLETIDWFLCIEV
jgi:hypothetical protein